MTDRSTPLESVVEEARSWAERCGERFGDYENPRLAGLLTRLADRVEELEAALKETIEVVEALIVSPHVQVRSIRPRMERARHALSTQPHQDKT